jgi:hypothetical protein
MQELSMRSMMVLLLVWAALSQAQPVPHPATATQPALETSEKVPEHVPPADTKPLPGPKYAPLRFNDDFSYLEGPEGSYQKDFFDPIKHIRLGDDLTLRLGGDIRGRLESVTHKRYGAEDPTNDTFFLHRYMAHVNAEYRKLIRVYFEGITAFAEDVDGTPLPNPTNRWDVHQMFFDVRFLGEDIPLTLRIGRQELLYGAQRLVSPLGWANVQRTWDGAKLFWTSEQWDIDGFYTRPVIVDPKGMNRCDRDRDFYGVYATYKGIPRHGIDLYYLGLRDRGDFVNANVPLDRNTGDLSLNTHGARFFGKTPVGPHLWDYDTELAGQWGRAAGDTIQAWMWAGQTGYTFSNVPWTPRIGIGVDYASGDRNPLDSYHQTFNQLFPLGHAYFGYLDQIGRQNIWAQNVQLSAKPFQNVTTQLAYHTFWLDKTKDELYNAAGAPVRRRTTGDVGAEVGHEFDLTINWQVDAHMSVLFGYSHMWTSDFIQATGPSKDPSLFYVMYQYRF